jgi:hypothetical protein
LDHSQQSLPIQLPSEETVNECDLALLRDVFVWPPLRQTIRETIREPTVLVGS